MKTLKYILALGIVAGGLLFAAPAGANAAMPDVQFYHHHHHHHHHHHWQL